jgi:phage major head subunit gpT-like protein
MFISPATMNALFTTFETQWQYAYEQIPTVYQNIATTYPSSSRFQTYAWPAQVPRMRQWLGDRIANNMAPYVQTVENLDWEDTLILPRNMIEDDQYDVFASSSILQLAQAAKKQPDYLLVSAMVNGATTIIWDNANFFDTAHPVDVRNAALSTQANKFASTALTPDNYFVVRAAMMSFKAESNKPLGVMPDTLVVAPKLEAQGRQILHADFIAPATLAAQTQVGSNQNFWKGTAELLVIPELTGQFANDAAWMLIDTKKVVRPFIWQLRKPAEFTYLNNPSDPNVFDRNEFKYGVFLRGQLSYSLWFLAALAFAGATQ